MFPDLVLLFLCSLGFILKRLPTVWLITWPCSYYNLFIILIDSIFLQQLQFLISYFLAMGHLINEFFHGLFAGCYVWLQSAECFLVTWFLSIFFKRKLLFCIYIFSHWRCYYLLPFYWTANPHVAGTRPVYILKGSNRYLVSFTKRWDLFSGYSFFILRSSLHQFPVCTPACVRVCCS